MCGVSEKSLVEAVDIKAINQLKEVPNEVRKEKSRDAARQRRAQESDFFQELSELLPVHGTPPNSQMTSIDKTSLIRLSVAYLKSRDFINNGGIHVPQIKEEVDAEIDVLEALGGFSLLLNQDQDIVHVSNNVANYIGLTSFELLGQQLNEFIHPCDHTSIKNLLPNVKDEQDVSVQAYLRIKCTITDRGRLINLKQANYKALKVEGRAHYVAPRGEGGLSGVLFLGVCTLVSAEMALDTGLGVFVTKHSWDFKIMEPDGWLVCEGGYRPDLLQGCSFFQLIHAQDTNNFIQAFRKLREHGHCETAPYRLLLGGGGFIWVQTKGAYLTPRRGSNKGDTILCSHTRLTEILNEEEVLALVQTELCRTTGSYTDQEVKPSQTEAMVEKENMNDILLMLDREAEELRIKRDMDTLDQAGFDLSPICSDVYEDLLSVSEDDISENCSLHINPLKMVQHTRRSSVIVSPVPTPVRAMPVSVTSQLSGLCAPALEKSNEHSKKSEMKHPLTLPATFIQEEKCEDGWVLEEHPQPRLVSPKVYASTNLQEKSRSMDPENLSPFIGAECIALNKMDGPVFQTIDLEIFDDLDFLDEDVLGFNASTEKLFSNVSPEKMFKNASREMFNKDDYAFGEETNDNVFILPEIDIMWGCSQDGVASEGFIFPGFSDPSPSVGFVSPPPPQEALFLISPNLSRSPDPSGFQADNSDLSVLNSKVLDEYESRLNAGVVEDYPSGQGQSILESQKISTLSYPSPQQFYLDPLRSPTLGPAPEATMTVDPGELAQLPLLLQCAEHQNQTFPGGDTPILQGQNSVIVGPSGARYTMVPSRGNQATGAARDLVLMNLLTGNGRYVSDNRLPAGLSGGSSGRSGGMYETLDRRSPAQGPSTQARRPSWVNRHSDEDQLNRNSGESWLVNGWPDCGGRSWLVNGRPDCRKRRWEGEEEDVSMKRIQNHLSQTTQSMQIADLPL